MYMMIYSEEKVELYNILWKECRKSFVKYRIRGLYICILQYMYICISIYILQYMYILYIVYIIYIAENMLYINVIHKEHPKKTC